MTLPAKPSTIDLLSTRRSVGPSFLAEPGPSAEELERLLTLAARVPDHGKLVPWRFIVFEGAGRDKAGEIIAKAFAEANPDADEGRVAAERSRLARAPLVIGVVSRAAPHEPVHILQRLEQFGHRLGRAFLLLGWGSRRRDVGFALLSGRKLLTPPLADGRERFRRANPLQ